MQRYLSRAIALYFAPAAYFTHSKLKAHIQLTAAYLIQQSLDLQLISRAFHLIVLHLFELFIFLKLYPLFVHDALLVIRPSCNFIISRTLTESEPITGPNNRSNKRSKPKHSLDPTWVQQAL
jgi:hypothetical protein